MDAQEKYEYWLDIAQYDLDILFEDLRSFYLNGRYADFKQKLSVSTDEATAKDYLNQTKEVFAWLLTQKP
ncbi:hypothetical protein AGMMS49983_13830 [Clostridia bacterium]|nr:hypothetical protein AGMMS49983_13830 [Clostridia bacterium]